MRPCASAHFSKVVGAKWGSSLSLWIPSAACMKTRCKVTRFMTLASPKLARARAPAVSGFASRRVRSVLGIATAIISGI